MKRRGAEEMMAGSARDSDPRAKIFPSAERVTVGDGRVNAKRLKPRFVPLTLQ